MLLCLDAGNSRLKAGIAEGDAWHWDGALDYNLLEALWPVDLGPVRQVVACNVAGPEVAARIAAWVARQGWTLDWLRPRTSCGGLHNGYRDPAQLGADRYAALLAARGEQLGQDVPRPCLVVLAGTATTIDALDADGRFRGGFILPGLSLMTRALARHTAQLPQADGTPMTWPDHTDAAIISGSLLATLGAIERALRQFGGDPRCLLAGGAASLLAQHDPAFSFEQRPRLVLDGLRRYATIAPDQPDG